MNLRLKLWLGCLALGMMLSGSVLMRAQASMSADESASVVHNQLNQSSGITAPQMVQDTFGYLLTVSTVTNTGWIDTSAGTLVTFTSPDDGYNNDLNAQQQPAPINLGFSFPFYEFNYNALFISTNGKLTFEPMSSPSNEAIPLSTAPNPLIAPFWDDLYVGGADGDINQGEVYYLSGGNAPNRFFVVEWRQVSRLSEGASPLTFQAILRENGNIDFLYQQLNGNLADCTIGIEDGDGVDGFQYIYNQAGLSQGMALRFSRPAADWRVKMVVLYASALINNNYAYIPLQVRNSGSRGGDTYNFNFNSNQPGWQLTLLADDGIRPLGDSDNDSRQDSGVLAQGQTLNIWLQVKAPISAPIGEYVQATITATSKGNPARSASARADAAVPAPFSFAFSDRRGIRLGYISRYAQAFPEVQTNYTGSALAIAQTANGGFFYTWEKNITSNLGAQITNVEFALFSRFGRLQRQITRITDHQNSAIPVFDLNPATTVAPDGKIGVTWVRDANGVQNVMFTALSSQGDPFSQPNHIINVTQQTGFDVLYGAPLLTDVSDGGSGYQYVLIWASSDQVSGHKDIWSAGFRVNSSNQLEVLRGAQRITDAAGSGAEYQDPQITTLSDGRVVVAYSKRLLSSETLEIIGLNRFGEPLAAAPLTIPSARGSKKDILQIAPDGAIGLAWTDSQTEQMRFTVINANLSSAQTSVSLNAPNGRTAGEPSLALAPDGRVILHWLDDRSYGFLYYALLDSFGNVITPPLVYHQAQRAEALNTSANGQGILNMSGFSHSNLPVIRK